MYTCTYKCIYLQITDLLFLLTTPEIPRHVTSCVCVCMCVCVCVCVCARVRGLLECQPKVSSRAQSQIVCLKNTSSVFLCGATDRSANENLEYTWSRTHSSYSRFRVGLPNWMYMYICMYICIYAHVYTHILLMLASVYVLPCRLAQFHVYVYICICTYKYIYI